MKPITTCDPKKATAVIHFYYADGSTTSLYFKRFADAVGFATQENLERSQYCIKHIWK